MNEPLFDFAAPVVDVQSVSPTGAPVSIPYAQGSATSHAAAIRAEKFVAEQGLRVLAWIKAQGERGGTQKEAHVGTGIERSSLCARFNALEGVHAILKTGVRRDGCAVYTVMEGLR